MLIDSLRSWWSGLWGARKTSGQGSQAQAWDGKFEDTLTSAWAQSVALDQLTANDFTCVLRALQTEYPNSRQMRPRFIELVSRWVGDVAVHYDRPPLRRFGDASATAADWTKLQDVYERSNINGGMRTALRKLVTQNCVLVLPWYKDLRTVEILSFCPYEFEVVPGDPMLAGDVQRAARVSLRVPVGIDPEIGVKYGQLHMTAAEIWIEEEGGKKSSPYNQLKDDLRNPFAPRLPVVALRHGDAPKGQFCGPVDQALLNETLAICLGNASTDHTIKYHGFPTKYLQSGAESTITKADVSGLPSAPEYWAALPDGAQLGAVHTQIQVAEFDNHLEMNLKNFAVLRGLPPDWFLKTYTNVASKTLDRHDAKVRSAVYLPTLEQAETELCHWVARLVSHRGEVAVPDNLKVQVTWSEWHVDADPVQAATARQTCYASGEDSPAAFVARRDGVSLTVAQQRVKDNLAASKELGHVPVQQGPVG